MVLNIRNPDADRLARQLAEMNQSGLTEAVVIALTEAIERRAQAEGPRQAAARILKSRGLKAKSGRTPVPEYAYHHLDHDL